MHTDVVFIDRVDRTTTWRVTTLRFTVTGRYADGRLGVFQASTTSTWAASVCQRAVDTHRPLAVTWQGVGPWMNIVSCEFADQKASA